MVPAAQRERQQAALAIGAAMDFATELRRRLAAQGMSLREAARRVPCDSGYLSKVAADRKNPSADLAARLDEVLDAGGDLAALAAAPASGMPSELDLIELARRAEVSDVGTVTLGLLTGAVDSLCCEYPHVSAGQVAGQAMTHLRYVTGLLEGRVTLAQHRELLVLAGWLAALIACADYDAGDRPGARAACRMAREFAGQAGHGEVAAWSYETAAWFAVVEGRYPETVALAEAGLEHAGVTSAAVQLTLQAARGYARMGDSRAREALRAGRAVLDRLPEPEQPDHHFVFDGSKYEFYAGSILTWLGNDDTAAEEHARYVVDSATTDTAGRWPMRVAISQLDLAIIAGRRGDLDEAVTLGTAALAHSRRSAQLLPRARELAAALAERYPGEPLTAAYAEALVGAGRPAMA